MLRERSHATDTSPGWAVPGSIFYGLVEILRPAQNDITKNYFFIFFPLLP